MKNLRRSFLLCASLALFLFASSASATVFTKTGTIMRVMSSADKYAGCMVLLDTTIANGCPYSGWVSLDCNADLIGPDTGKRNYASALLAFTSGMTVTLFIDNSLKADGFCAATRLDLLG
jgi:hypothetical protein